MMGSGYPTPEPLPATPTRADPEIEEARRRALVAARTTRGRGATLIARRDAPDSAQPLMALPNGGIAGGSSASLVLGG